MHVFILYLKNFFNNKMLIDLNYLVKKYSISFNGILHIGAHECEELPMYENYISRQNIVWIEAMKDKVDQCKLKWDNLLIENAVVSDRVEDITFNIANNGQSSSMLDFGLHNFHHPHIHYTNTIKVKTVPTSQIINNYPHLTFNFLNLDIQGAELKALIGMEDYLKTGKVEYIYTEVNSDYVYKNCALVTELDDYLKKFGLLRVETSWCSNYQWGDAFYVKEPLY